MYKIPDEVINFIGKTMKTWRVELMARGRSLSEAKLHRGIFQGDALSLLPYVIAMMPTQPHTQKIAQPDTNLVNCRKRSIKLV